MNVILREISKIILKEKKFWVGKIQETWVTLTRCETGPFAFITDQVDFWCIEVDVIWHGMRNGCLHIIL